MKRILTIMLYLTSSVFLSTKTGSFVLLTIMAFLFITESASAQNGTADTRDMLDSLLCDLGRKDQEVRADWAKLVAGRATQDEVIAYALKMEEADNANLEVVSRILDTYGWPDGLSDDANNAIFLVIDHSDLETMNKYRKMFHDAVEKGYVQMNDLVTMGDRMLMNAGKPQKYGTQAYSITEGGKTIIYIWPIEDPAKLDSLRKSVGLIPIENYLEIVKQQGVEIIYDKTKTVEDFIQH